MKYCLLLILLLYPFKDILSQGTVVKIDTTKKLSDEKNYLALTNYYRLSLEKAVANKEDEHIQANLHDSIGKYAYLKEDFKLAETFFSSGLLMREKLSGLATPEYAFTATYLGDCYTTLALYAKAIPLLEKAIEIRRTVYGTESLDYATTANFLGRAYFRTRKLNEAESVSLEARNIRKQKLGAQHSDYLMATVDLGNIYYTQGRNKQALSLYGEVRDQFIRAGDIDNKVYTRATLNSGAIFFGGGQYQLAKPLLEEANQLIRKNNIINPLQQGLSNYYLGSLYSMLARHTEARSLLEESKNIALQFLTRNHMVYYASTIALGHHFVATGQFNKAEENLLEAREIVEKVLGKENAYYVLTSKGLAQLYFNQVKYKLAAPYIEESLGLSSRISGEQSLDYAEACIVSGIFYYNTREFLKAEKFTKLAKDLFETISGKGSRNYSESSYYLGRLYVLMEQYDLAEEYLLEAKYWAEQSILGKGNRTYAEICEQLALTYWNKGDRQNANKFFSIGKEILEENRRKYFIGSTEAEQNTYAWRVDRFVNMYYSFISIKPADSDGNLAYDFALSHRNAILNSSSQLRQMISSVKDPSIKDKYAEWINAREELSRMTNYRSRDSISLLEKKVAEQETELARLSSQFRKINRVEVGWGDVQAKLKADEAAIEFVSFHYHNGKTFTDSFLVIAIVLKATGSPQVLTLCTNAAVDKLLTRRTSSRASAIDMLYKDKKLTELVWMPLEQKLQGIKTVYFSLSGALHRVSFAALPLKEGHLLSEKYRLEQLLSTGSIKSTEVENLIPGDMITAYGGVAFQADSISLLKAARPYDKPGITRSVLDEFTGEGDFNQFQPLPNSEIEIRNIENAAKQSGISLKLYSGVNANEESVKAFSGENSPTVLHFATHGFFFKAPFRKPSETVQSGLLRFSEDPLLRSGLILAGAENTWKGKPTTGIEDGVLTAYEVAGLYLPNTKLVVLSACETGAGDLDAYEGVFGLQRAFKIAGVDYLMMSLWELNDKAAAEFMQEFYSFLCNKHSVRDAFSHAQTKMKNKYSNQPYFWAGFILTQ